MRTLSGRVIMCCLIVVLAVVGYLYVNKFGWTLPKFGKKDDQPD